MRGLGHTSLPFFFKKQKNDFLATRRSAGAAPILLVVKVPQHFLGFSGSVEKSGFYFADRYQKQRNGGFLCEEQSDCRVLGSAGGCWRRRGIHTRAAGRMAEPGGGAGGAWFAASIIHARRKRFLYSCKTAACATGSTGGTPLRGSGFGTPCPSASLCLVEGRGWERHWLSWENTGKLLWDLFHP